MRLTSARRVAGSTDLMPKVHVYIPRCQSSKRGGERSWGSNCTKVDKKTLTTLSVRIVTTREAANQPTNAQLLQAAMVRGRRQCVRRRRCLPARAHRRRHRKVIGYGESLLRDDEEPVHFRAVTFDT